MLAPASPFKRSMHNNISALARRGLSEPRRDAQTVLGILLAAALAFSAVLGSAVAVFRPRGCTLPRTPQSDASAIASAATLWITDHAGSCPTAMDLVVDGVLDAHRRVLDPQGRPFVIKCEGDGVTASSPGVDGIFGTADDITG